MTDLIAAIQRDMEAAQLLLDGVSAKLAALVAANGPDPVSKKRHWYTERNDIVLRDYPIGVPNETIAERVNALPGDRVALKAIAIQAHRLGVGRPAGYTWGFAKKTSDFAYQRGDGSQVEPAAKATQPVAPEAPAKPRQMPAITGADMPVAGRPSVPGTPIVKPPAPQPKSRTEALMTVSRAIETKLASAAPKTSFNSFSGPKSVRPTTAAEEDMIARHIANKGITKLPAAAVEFTTATISAEDRAAIVAHRAQREAAELAKMTGWRVAGARGGAAFKKAVAMRSLA